MSTVLSAEKKQQVIALGKLGWPLRRIEQATGVRRETAGAYLAAGIAISRTWALSPSAKSRQPTLEELVDRFTPFPIAQAVLVVKSILPRQFDSENVLQIQQ